MTIYILFFALLSLASYVTYAASGVLKTLQRYFLLFILILFIGFRHDVGGDWYNYIANYEYLKGLSFDQAKAFFVVKDSAYTFLYWISVTYLNGIYFTNFICSVIFAIGLIRFNNYFSPHPWFALLISFPYIIIIVSMGYTRQAAALGLIMYGLVNLVKGENLKFYVFIFIGSLFHKTALIAMLVGVLYNYKFNLKQNILLILFILFSLGIYEFKKEEVDFLVYHYVTNVTLNSSGALARIIVNSVPALIFLLYIKRFYKEYDDGKLWLIFSLISIILIPLAVYYSTFTDRVGIYFSLIQLVVLSRFVFLIRYNDLSFLFMSIVIICYFVFLLIWLNFGIHAEGWLPYSNYLIRH